MDRGALIEVVGVALLAGGAYLLAGVPLLLLVLGAYVVYMARSV